MSATRLSRVQKATALVPLALLSAAWTANLAGAGAGGANLASSTSDPSSSARLPDGTSVPGRAIEAPASVSAPESIVPGSARRGAARITDVSAAAIPAAALSAYQRAETVINAADTSCNLRWQLVAAIGRIESDHGRYGGNQLDTDGVAVPGIYGIALDGTRNTARISDTDAGQFDNDTRWDRAVGPMQFIPSTWSVVGVDADGDGQRNPQDVDDAALATAVYLCSGEEDLSTLAGQRSAVHRYNHSDAYVDAVLAVMNSYLAGNFTSTPNSTTTAGYLVPDTDPRPGQAGPAGAAKGEGRDGPRPGKGEAVIAAPQPSQPTAAPTQPSGGGGGGGGENGSGGNGGGDSGGSKGGLGIPGAPTVSLPALPSTGVTPLDGVLSHAQAVVQCTLDGYFDNIFKTDDPFDRCVQRYTSP
ncbi:lytic transglycosylase domain-containing protein [Nocardioides ochotonae]|uniref:lytic transglycosylase domain-containing protein n=1 Tax=Nocardioides ochotonae TaxID=2685869 RepID=UPI0014074F33|nr:lytic transglycosylase domain-containing protein [Nocardioides ochotonae]